MSLKSALITTATLTALVSFAGQDPRLDYSFAAPALDEVSVAEPAAPVVQAPKKNVTVSFKNATVGDVLNWAQKQGVNFIMEDATVRNKRVTINVTDQPLQKVLDALAVSLNGRWERREDILVFRQGAGIYSFAEMPAIQGVAPRVDLKDLPTPPAMVAPSLPTTPVPPAARVFGQGSPKLRAYSFGVDKDLAERIAKEVRESLKDSKVNDREFWEKFSKELEKSLEKSLPRTKIQGLRDTDFFKNRNWDVDRVRALDAHRVYRHSKAIDVEKFLNSLTPGQRDLQKSRGYIKISELLPSQRELLGIKADEEVTYEFVVKGERVKIQK